MLKFNRYLDFLKTHKWLSLVVGVFGLTFLYLLFQKPPKTPIPTTPPTPPLTSQFGQLNTQVKLINNASIDVPNEVSIYTYQPTPTHQFAAFIANQLNLTPHPESKSLWLSQNKKSSLSLSTNTGVLTYSQEPTTTTPSPTNTTEAVHTSKEFLQKIGVQNPLINNEEVVFFDSHLETTNTPTNLINTHLIRIPYHHQLNNLPLVPGNISTQELYVEIATSGAISKTTLYSIPTTITEKANIKSIPIEAVLEKFAVQAIITYVDSGFENAYVKPSEFKQITLNKGVLEYRLVPALQEIRPYFSFRATGVNHQNQTIDLEIILPATE